MAKFYQGTKFLQLHKEWRQRLHADGFVDIERDDNTLKQWAKNYSRGSRKIIIESKQEYYQRITHHCHESPPKNQIHLEIMTMRGDAIKILQIAAKLSLNRHTITFIIRRYEHLWGIRYWSAKQRNLKNG